MKKAPEKIKDLKNLLSAQPIKELGLDQIIRTIPHREPFLFIDRVRIIEDKKYAVGIKHVKPAEPFFKGHFPQKPVMPAVLVLEAMAQTCGAMMMSYPEWKNKIAYFMAVEKAKFRKPVLPADTLEIALEILRFGTVGRCRACAYVKSEIAAQAQMSFILSGK